MCKDMYEGFSETIAREELRGGWHERGDIFRKHGSMDDDIPSFKQIYGSTQKIMTSAHAYPKTCHYIAPYLVFVLHHT